MGSTPRGYKTADTGGIDASRKRKETLDEQFGSGTESNIMKIDKDITALEDEIDLLPETFLSETLPTNWKEGDWWLQVIRERVSSIEQISEILGTIPYDSTKDYHLKSNNQLETIENINNGDLIVEIK